MTTLSAICKRLLHELPGFAAKGRLLFTTPVGHVLGGVYLNSSAFDAARFSVLVFVVPLFLPTDAIYFNFGKEVQNDRGVWDLNDPTLLAELTAAIKEQALPFLDQASTLEGVARTGPIHKRDDPIVQEAVARAYVLVGDTDRAIREFDRLESMILHDPQCEILLRETRKLKARIASDPRKAAEELLECENTTARALGVGKFREKQ